VVRLRATGRNQLVADGTGERQVGDGRVDVPEFAPPEAKLDSAEAMGVDRNALPG
jgi:hypothetical protein